MHRAVLEGTAMGFRTLKEAGFGNVTALRMLGGGTKSAAWMQIMADVLGCEIQVVSDAEHAGARGMATLAAAALGWQAAGAGAADFVRVAAVYKPDAQAVALYNRLFGAYRTAHSALRPMFTQLASFRDMSRPPTVTLDSGSVV